MSRTPRVSLGIPVYNGEQTLAQTLDSLLAQTFEDFEVVIADNDSQDRTQEVGLAYAAKDPRVRYHCNETNVGQIANFNRVFELSRGAYFRWIGCNDWLAPEYLERCVEALEARPDAVLVTCYQKHFSDDGRRFYEEYTGPRPDSDRPHRRFARMLWFLRRSRYYIDPIYSLIRRSALEQTELLPAMLGTDLVLASELSLIGPWCHVPECLAFRRNPANVPRAQLVKQYDPELHLRRAWRLRIARALTRRMLSRPLCRREQAACLCSIAKYYVLSQARAFYRLNRRRISRLIRYRAIKTFVRSRLAVAPVEEGAVRRSPNPTGKS